MASLNKSTVALTFKFDCDRFLRFRLAKDEERIKKGSSDPRRVVPDAQEHRRPGIDLIKIAGRVWEAGRYQDLIDTTSSEDVAYSLDDEIDDDINRQRFVPLQDLETRLKQQTLPKFIVEGEFELPRDISQGLAKAFDDFGLESAKGRPDILWVRPGGTGVPLIGKPEKLPEYELHIIDVKMAAEPSLRHFVEVTLYALGLNAWLRNKGLLGRIAVSAVGYVWPGSHDVHAFRNLVREMTALGKANPVDEALAETLKAVPYETYNIRVLQFLNERLPRVLAQEPLEAAWHVAPKCQLCDYMEYCREKAAGTHLSCVPFLTAGQATVLRNAGINTVSELASNIKENSSAWQQARTQNHALRGEAPGIRARALALAGGQAIPVEGRKTFLMPKWSTMSICITVHFDPGSGVAFALGASKVFFRPGREAGSPPETDRHVFVVDRMESMRTDSERNRLLEFARCIRQWLEEASALNAQAKDWKDEVSVQLFVWDQLEITQLGRMLERHLESEDVLVEIQHLLRVFPPQAELPDPDLMESQPATIVKEVIRTLVGLPIPHCYTLFDTYNTLYPRGLPDGKKARLRPKYGFVTDMSDQIPFERAYELWQDDIYLKHYVPNETDRKKWPKYTRDELTEEMRVTVRMYLQALEEVVGRIRKNLGDRLLLKKQPLQLGAPTQFNVPDEARKLIAFSKLNAVTQKLENRQKRALPVDEREAQFVAIRGLTVATGAVYDDVCAQVHADPRYRDGTPIALTFCDSSRDSKIEEGAFLVAISNEDSEWDIDQTWYGQCGLDLQAAEALFYRLGINKHPRQPLRNLLQVTVAKVDAVANVPYLVIIPNKADLFRVAQQQGFLDLNRPMVLDQLVKDFESPKHTAALRAIGGKWTRPKRRKGKK